jgi:hypothetical protein
MNQRLDADAPGIREELITLLAEMLVLDIEEFLAIRGVGEHAKAHP